MGSGKNWIICGVKKMTYKIIEKILENMMVNITLMSAELSQTEYRRLSTENQVYSKVLKLFREFKE